MTTKKREYEKPSMQVFDLKQRPVLLVGSDPNAGVENYDWHNEVVEE